MFLRILFCTLLILLVIAAVMYFNSYVQESNRAGLGDCGGNLKARGLFYLFKTG